MTSHHLTIKGLFSNSKYARAHSVIARKNIAMVLASKVDEGVYSMARTKKYARWLLRENAERLFLKPKST